MTLDDIIPAERPNPDAAPTPQRQMFHLSHLRGSANQPAEMSALFRSTVVEDGQERYVSRADFPRLIEQWRYSWRDLPAVAQDAEPETAGDVERQPGDPARAIATASRTVMLYTPLVLPPVGHPSRAAVQASFTVLTNAINAGLAAVSQDTRTAILSAAQVPVYPLPSIEGLLSSQVGVLLTPWAEKSEG